MRTILVDYCVAQDINAARNLGYGHFFTLAETPLTVRLAYSEVRLVSLLIRSTQYSMRISLKDTQIAGYWATARKKYS